MENASRQQPASRVFHEMNLQYTSKNVDAMALTVLAVDLNQLPGMQYHRDFLEKIESGVEG